MKILQIAPPWIATPPNGYGGTELVVYNLCKGFVELGHDVTLFATKDSKSPDELDYVFNKGLIDMDIDWSASLPPFLHYHQAFQNADQFDIVHAHLSSGTDLMILPFMSDLMKKGIPTVMTIHGHWPYDRTTFMDPYFKKLYAENIPVISISRTMQKLVPKEFRDVGYVHNSIEPSTLKYYSHSSRHVELDPVSASVPAPMKKADSGSRSGMTNTHKGYLTWLGKIVPDKGTHEAILAAKAAGEKFVFAGIVDKYQKISVEYFETKVKPLIDDDQVVYLGPADVKMKNKLFGEAKAFLNPINWEEPFGMVMVESLACGTPVISFNRGAAPEIIKNGKNGFLVKNRKEMIKAIGKLDQIKRKDCRKYIEDNFSPRAASEKHIEIYEREISNMKSKFTTRHPEFISGSASVASL
jgi:glycosyltransferase involved in cell wall biosynthesis